MPAPPSSIEPVCESTGTDAQRSQASVESGHRRGRPVDKRAHCRLSTATPALLTSSLHPRGSNSMQLFTHSQVFPDETAGHSHPLHSPRKSRRIRTSGMGRKVAQEETSVVSTDRGVAEREQSLPECNCRNRAKQPAAQHRPHPRARSRLTKFAELSRAQPFRLRQ